ncbi:MAG: prephenate dehydrogenase [Anaerolineae bacterium]
MGQPIGKPALPQGCKVAIVGLGLMGGSLARALRNSRPDVHVLGVARRSETLQQALTSSLIESGSTSMEEIIPEAEVVVLAAPVRIIANQIGQVAMHLRRDAVLTDLGSTKCSIVAAMEKLHRSSQCVGGHPMCGKERSGLAEADALLYKGATWAICATRDSLPEAIELVAALATDVGAKPLFMQARHHDAIVARTSHLPYTISACLARTVARAVSDSEIRELSAGGYRDTTRLAASDIGMMLDILLTNREQVLASLADFRDELDNLTALLHSADETGLRRYLECARQERRLS